MRRFKFFVAAVALMVLSAAVVPTASAQNTATWKAQFYNNLFLSGFNPAFETTYTNGLNVDWGAGSPDASIQADNFSARFSTDVFFNASTYRFSIRADDEFQLRINDNIVLSTMNAGQPSTVLTIDLNLSGATKLQVDYRERTGGASISLTWADLNVVEQPVPTGTWLAEYFPNTSLAQPAAVILNESSPTHNWGFSAPLPNMPAEYWTARWRTSQVFAGGTYRFRAKADDGVRVFVDNVAIIDRFVESPGAEHIVDYAIGAGTHVITVEYLELYNNAFIEFSITQLTSTGSPQPPAGSPTATVRAFVLNVRSAPSAVNTLVLKKIKLGETYPVIGRNAAGTWFKINTGDVQGWVSGGWVITANVSGVPVLSESTESGVPSSTVLVETVGVRLNFRAGPSTDAASLGLIAPFSTLKVLGRNADASWLQVEYAGQVGWVAFAFVTASTPVNFFTLPVTG
ncbi:MAG: SH3 domain-containing protein [Anaerolineae bacterium]|nr:SH3 domain-containing protein [Anaerolineae bacterium]